MTMQTSTKTRFRPAPLAASLALLWSGTTFAVPGEPVLNVSETDFVLSDSAQNVQVPVNWNRYYGEPALTAQYWIDDKLVLTRAVEAVDFEAEDAMQAGGATLTIEGSGEVELAVSLCDTEGCSGSAPVIVTVIDPESPLQTIATADADTAMLSFEEAHRIVTESQARLAQDAQFAGTAAALTDQSWGVWFAGLVGQAAAKYGLSMGFDLLATKIGLGSGGPDLAASLDGIEQSLGEVKNQLDAISRQIDVNKADSDFKNSHRDAAVAMGNIRTIAKSIAQAEAGVFVPTQYQLESWAKDNRNNIAALHTLLVDPLTGAVRLMLDYYQLKYPVSSGIEVRSQVDGYLDGFRATLGVALLNQAWLTKAFAPNGAYDEGANADVRATVSTAYGLAGAPYPQPPSGLTRFIHRIGTSWALIDGARQDLGAAENARTSTQNRNEVTNIYGTIAAGVNAPGNQTIENYMVANGIKRLFKDPNSVRIDKRDSFFECELWVRHDGLYVGGNSAGQTTYTTYHKKYACIANGTFAPQARNEKARLEQTLGQTEHVWKVNVPTNTWGMPALVDERAIRGFRDGIQVESMTRGAGNAVRLALKGNGYSWIQVHDPDTGEMLGSASIKTGSRWGELYVPVSFDNLQPSKGAVEVRLGYKLGQPGDGDMVTMERTLVTANPGSTTIDLTINPQ